MKKTSKLPHHAPLKDSIVYAIPKMGVPPPRPLNRRRQCLMIVKEQVSLQELLVQMVLRQQFQRRDGTPLRLEDKLDVGARLYLSHNREWAVLTRAERLRMKFHLPQHMIEPPEDYKNRKTNVDPITGIIGPPANWGKPNKNE